MLPFFHNLPRSFSTELTPFLLPWCSFCFSFNQAAIIKRKKETTAEKLNDVRASLQAAEEELVERRQQIQVSTMRTYLLFLKFQENKRI
jgi:hypothetical protein